MKHWGRIFFLYEGDRLTTVKAQPLHNHVHNCRCLLESFSANYFDAYTKERLLRAVAIHDDGKKQTFSLRDQEQTPQNNKGKKRQAVGPGSIVYSFAGHRFRVHDPDPYITALVRSHHEFSVRQINREKAYLGPIEKKRFADDLYLLCMADQLEAELATRVVEEKNDPSRPFVEFITEKIVDKEYRVVH